MTNLWRRWRRPDHRWPKYLPGGRFRTSTVTMVILFAGLAWVQQTYQPPTPPPTPETAVVPPGFVPDPQYTWVPRTDVRTQESRETTTTTTTTPTSPTESTSPGETTTPTSPSESTSATPTTTAGSGGSETSSPQTGTGGTSTTSAPVTGSAGPVTPTTVPAR